MLRSNIFLTRAGYFFQDKVAIFLFLRHFNQRDLKEFFVDFPLKSNQKSLDVRLTTEKGLEKIYEIKSGETFKNSEEEILDAISDLHNYFQKKSQCKTYLIVSHGFKPAISRIWSGLITLRRYQILKSKISIKIAKELLIKLNKRRKIFKRIQDVHNFIRQLNLDDPFSDENMSDSENQPEIEKFIITEIDNIFTNFNSDSTKKEYPTENIFYDLMYKCIANSGSQINLLPLFTKSILGHITIRRILSKHFKRPCDFDQKSVDISKEVKEDFYKWWTPELTTKGEQSSIKTYEQ